MEFNSDLINSPFVGATISSNHDANGHSRSGGDVAGLTLFNGGVKEEEPPDYSQDLAKLELILEEATQCLPESSSLVEVNSKSKSNPLLDQLLDKPLDDGDLQTFDDDNSGYLEGLQDNDRCDFASSHLVDCKPSFIEVKSERNEDMMVFGRDQEDDGGDDDDENDREEEEEDEEEEEEEEEQDEDEDEDDIDNEDNGEEDEEEAGEDEENVCEESGNTQVKCENEEDGTNGANGLPELPTIKEETEPEPQNNGKRKRTARGKNKKRKTDIKTEGDGEKKGKAKTNLMRKNIKKIMSEENIGEVTLQAQKEEAERLKRVEERAAMVAKQNQKLLLNNHQIEDVMVLSSDDESTSPSTKPGDNGQQRKKADSDADIIEIKSGDSESSDDSVEDFPHHKFPRNGSNNKRDYTRHRKAKLDEEFVDANNCGAHTDDRFNQPDDQGRVLVNVGHPEDEEPIYLPAQLSTYVKPHQIGGIRFLYDNIIDNMKKFPTSNGLGCILAHSMGLGKTLQLISFIDVFLTHTESKYVLCIVPINTLQNWMNEFDMWLPSQKTAAFRTNSADLKFRQFEVFILNDCKTLSTRAKEILAWRKSGGVLLIGYEMYRILTNNAKGKAKMKDTEGLTQETYNHLMSELKKALVDPGPDLVVCDEGHRIKNCNAATSQALKNIKTRRRVVLTGYPLQNNLVEYWCMVDFVRPNFLGTKQEFCNMFERPISNGQCADSTPEDRRMMKHRAHVLHKLLRGFVQRRSHSILTKSLPRKHEHVILVRMTPIQRTLMLAFLDRLRSDTDNSHRFNPIMLFSVFCKIWNHPDILYKIVKEGQNFDDLDIDLVGNTTKTSDKKGGRKATQSVNSKSASNSSSTVKSNPTASTSHPATRSTSNVKIDSNQSVDTKRSITVEIEPYQTPATFHSTTSSYQNVKPEPNLESHTRSYQTQDQSSYHHNFNPQANMDMHMNQSSSCQQNSYHTGYTNSYQPSPYMTQNACYDQPSSYNTSSYIPSDYNQCLSNNSVYGVYSNPNVNPQFNPSINSTMNSNSTMNNHHVPSVIKLESNGGLNSSQNSTLTSQKQVKQETPVNSSSQLPSGSNSSSTASTPITSATQLKPTATTSTTRTHPPSSSSNGTSYQNRVIDYAWAEPIVQDYTPGMLESGLKMLLFFEMLEQTILVGDKILVFSHSLFTLDIIEKFLSQRYVPKENPKTGKTEKWSKGVNYFRIDGSTNSTDREKLINTFNNSSHIHLFLLSTRAGCLGINLIGANRIIVFDASWNPCHDAQAACRIYRYGQQKECFIYRLICDESLEKRIYDRQITKQEVSHRVVDELNPETNFTKKEIDSLVEDLDKIDVSEIKQYTEEECNRYEDEIIRHLCQNMNHCLSKPPFEHESLLLDRKETKLSIFEKKQAEANYLRMKEEMATRGNSGMSRFNPSQMISQQPASGRGKNILGRPPLTFNSAGRTIYTPFSNSVWNNSLSQSTATPTRLPNILSRSNILTQFNNLPPAAFAEQLTRMGYSVKSIISPSDFNVPVNTANREPITIPKDKEIFIIKSPSDDLFLRTPEGRMVSLRIDSTKYSSLFGPHQSTTSTFPTILKKPNSLPIGPSPGTITNRPSTSKTTSTPEVIFLDDDD